MKMIQGVLADLWDVKVYASNSRVFICVQLRYALIISEGALLSKEVIPPAVSPPRLILAVAAFLLLPSKNGHNLISHLANAEPVRVLESKLLVKGR